MKKTLIVLISIVSLFAGWYGLITIASESGEVVTLYTLDDSGETATTRLWIVDYENQQYLRSGSAESGWLKRVRNSSEIKLERDGVQKNYKPVLTPELGEPINRLMTGKYGWADKLIGFFFGRDDAIPIRLIPGR